MFAGDFKVWHIERGTACLLMLLLLVPIYPSAVQLGVCVSFSQRQNLTFAPSVVVYVRSLVRSFAGLRSLALSFICACRFGHSLVNASERMRPQNSLACAR